ncbi:unnamed protein product [Effrenium voratum]|uniref:Transmembrane protein n=1 Tax=Effrenium voratum TaxID=2562239 RepID=A0AA36JJW1_9DINO|nr:unnamed protein product [Effrenium voratum]CAJ1420469.1 unnamed protein product [Effrenium voratum]
MSMVRETAWVMRAAEIEPGESCGSSSIPTNNTALRNEVLQNSGSFQCTNDAFGLSACEYGDLLNVANMMYANFYVNGLQFLVCMILIYSLGKFTHLPAEKLQFDKKNASRLMMLFGGICKQGPWLTRLLHLVQGILIFGSWLMMVLGYCRGNLAYSSYCGKYSENCAYNKARNCQYYYVHCKPDATLLLGCYTQAGRAAFSGRVDVRVLSSVHCVACGILEADSANTMGVDEFYLLDDDSKGTDAWVCNDQLDGCFHTTAWSSIKCGTTKAGGACSSSLGGVVTADYLSGTLDAIACARRLYDTEEPDLLKERRRMSANATEVTTTADPSAVQLGEPDDHGLFLRHQPVLAEWVAGLPPQHAVHLFCWLLICGLHLLWTAGAPYADARAVVFQPSDARRGQHLQTPTAGCSVDTVFPSNQGRQAGVS